MTWEEAMEVAAGFYLKPVVLSHVRPGGTSTQQRWWCWHVMRKGSWGEIEFRRERVKWDE